MDTILLTDTQLSVWQYFKNESSSGVVWYSAVYKRRWGKVALEMVGEAVL